MKDSHFFIEKPTGLKIISFQTDSYGVDLFDRTQRILKKMGGIGLDPVIMPISDVLDLHTFNPKEVPDLLDDYLSECFQKGLFSIRIIHGKGQGVLKRRVQKLLERNPMVASVQDAPPEAGGWGATLVELRRK